MARRNGVLAFQSPDGSGTKIRPHNYRYTDQLAVKICERLMLGESLTKICEDPRMPSRPTVVRWLADPRMVGFREAYYHARRVQAELLIDEIFEISDDASNDWKPRFDKNGEIIDYIPDNETVHRARLMVDTRKWFAAKMVPKIYGEKIDVDLNATGDLAELLKQATNRDKGLPPPIEGELSE